MEYGLSASQRIKEESLALLDVVLSEHESRASVLSGWPGSASLFECGGKPGMRHERRAEKVEEGELRRLFSTALGFISLSLLWPASREISSSSPTNLNAGASPSPSKKPTLPGLRANYPRAEALGPLLP